MSDQPVVDNRIPDEPLPRPRRWLRRILVGLVVIFGLTAAGLIWAYHYRNDEALARMVMDAANPGLRGRLHFGSLHWSPRALVDLALGIPHRASARDFRVYDHQGRLVVKAEHAEASVELWPLISRGALLVHDAHVRGNAYVLVHTTAAGEIGIEEAFTGKQLSAGRGPELLFANATVDSCDVVVRWDGWSITGRKVALRGGYVHYTGGEVAVEGLGLGAKQARAASGELKIGETTLPLGQVAIDTGASTKDRSGIKVALATEIEGAPTRVRGTLLDVYREVPRLELRLTSYGLSALLGRLSGGVLSGDARVRLAAKGPFGSPRARGRFSKLKLKVGDVSADRLEGTLDLDAKAKTLAVSGVKAKVLGGKMAGGAHVDFGGDNWRATAKLTDVDPGRLERSLAGRLSGTVSYGGKLGEQKRGVLVGDLKLVRNLGRGRRDLLPREIAVKGTAHVSPPLIDFAGTTIAAEGVTATLRGSINVDLARTNLRVRLAAPRLDRWLARRRLPQLARSLTAELNIGGRYPRLTATGSLRARRVGFDELRMPQLKGDLRFSRGTLQLERIQSEGHGGTIRGTAGLQLFAGLLTRPLGEPRLHGQLKLKGIELARLLGLTPRGASTEAQPWLSGRASGVVSLGGAINAPTATAELTVAGLRIGDDTYPLARARLGVLDDRLTVYAAEFGRRGGGGLRTWGDLFFDGRLAARIKTTSLPLAAIPGVKAAGLGIGGRLDGELRASGSLGQPRLGGRLRLSGARFRGMSLGAGDIFFTPGSDIVRVKGRLFNKRVGLDGFMMMRPVPRVHLRAQIHRFPLERVVPELRALGDVTASVSGQVQLDADAMRGLSWASARFPEAKLLLRRRPPGSRETRSVVLSSRGPLVARYSGGKLSVVNARLVTAVDGSRVPGEFSVSGWLSGSDSDIGVRGRVALELAEFFLGRRIRSLSGFARANVRVAGPPGQPRLAGSLAIDRLALRMPRFDRAIEIPRGLIELAPGRLEVRSLPLVVDGQRLALKGKILLDRLRPTSTDLSLAGDFNVRLLRLIVPEALSQASGTARVALALQGPLENPQVRGRMDVRRIEVVPRATGRALTLAGGSIAFNNYLIKTLKPLEGSYDEGRVSIGGRMRLDRWEPVDIALEMVGTGIAARQPKVLLAEANVRLKLFGDSQALALLGEVDLVDARYVREFDIVKNALIRPRTSEEERPFWKGVPLLENLGLKLVVRAAGPLTVKNRYAELALDGSLAVSGTLADPRLDGQVRLEEGKFRIPFLHGEYTLERGEIVFDRKGTVEQAQLDITAENRVERGGEDYLIKLQLKGPLANVRLGLSSDPPLEPGQIATLLATGRTTEQLRNELRGKEGSAAGAADAQVKQLTGDLLGNIVEDQIRRVVRLDLFRLELGTETLGLRACKRFGRYLESCFKGEKALVGDDLRGEWSFGAKLHDYLRLIGRAEKLSTRIETEDENNNRLRLELKVRLRLR